MTPVEANGDLAFELMCLRQSIDNLELEFARRAAGLAESGQWEREGFNTPADWLRFNCNMTSAAAWNSLAVGEQEEKLAATADAMRSGEIGYAHVATMANTARAVKGFDERALLPLARKHSAGKFYYKCLHYRHSLDSKAYCEEQNDQDLNHHLRVSTAQSGHLLVNGVLDPVGGAIVRTALEALARPSGAHDDRKRENRLADAFVELASGHRPATLHLTATVETLRDLAGAAGGEMEFSLPLPAETVRRMSCDSNVMRVLLSEESVVVDVGRSKRMIEGGLRHALKVRDGHCRWPGCERPASWCDGHHVVHWADGGPTDLDNLVLVCKRHHRLLHEGGWQLIKVEGAVTAIAPVTIFGRPRGPD